jgi:hypothetical protein
MRIIVTIILLHLGYFLSLAQCDPYLDVAHSNRVANYKIDVTLDDETKCLEASQELIWINHSPDTVFAMRFYMYQNAFKNTESTFMKSAEGDVFGDDVSKRPIEEWGWIEVLSAKRNGLELIDNAAYVHPDDDNIKDETVLEIPLNNPLLPGDTLNLEMQWAQKIPRIFARSGYERESFYNMVHWFPQAGVWEQDKEGKWGWNCHQFHRRTEFYGDFGVFDVNITLAKHLVTGASGCEVDLKDNGDGTKTVSYHGEDIIDFAWCAYPHYEVIEEQWEHVYIRLLIPPEHCHHRFRILKTVKHSLQYLTENVGPYPYTSITVVDPPLLGLKSGFMEYPTFITGGSIALFPTGIKTLESLIAHEFTHQYFMGMVASNEKEEPWLDEGFVTYHEDKIMESMNGTNGSLFDILGYKVNNSSFSRHEYVSLDNPSCGIIARPGWEIREGFKGITYSKTATMLKTMEGMMGEAEFIQLMKGYFNRYKFKHPRGEDFINYVKDFMIHSINPMALGDVDAFFDQIVYSTDILDYSAANISYFKVTEGKGFFGSLKEKEFSEGKQGEMINSKALVHRKGGVILPVELRFTFEDGHVFNELWSGKETSKTYIFQHSSKMISIEIDPECKLYLDLNLNNNSLTVQPKKTPALKIASKVMYWVNNLVQTFGILI